MHARLKRCDFSSAYDYSKDIDESTTIFPPKSPTRRVVRIGGVLYAFQLTENSERRRPACQAPSHPAQATEKDARHPRIVHGLFRGRDARAPLRAMRRGAPSRRTRRTRRRRAFSHPQPREDGGRPSGGFLDDRRRASLPLLRRRFRSSARVFEVCFADRIRRRRAPVVSIAASRFKTSPAAIPVSHRRPRRRGFPPVDRRPDPPTSELIPI